MDNRYRQELVDKYNDLIRKLNSEFSMNLVEIKPRHIVNIESLKESIEDLEYHYPILKKIYEEKD